jgi:hypothetical protein
VGGTEKQKFPFINRGAAPSDLAGALFSANEMKARVMPRYKEA